NFRQSLEEPERAKFDALFMNKAKHPDDSILYLSTEKGNYFIKVDSGKIHKLDGGKAEYEINLREMTDPEVQSYLISKSRLPEKVHAVIVTETYVSEDDLTRWEFI